MKNIQFSVSTVAIVNVKNSCISNNSILQKYEV